MAAYPSSLQQRRRGMTLIEIMVVIAVIVILAGILVAVGTGTKGKALITQTRTTFTKLDGILKNYESAVGSPLAQSPPFPASGDRWPAMTNKTTAVDWVAAFQNYPASKAELGNGVTMVGTVSVVKDGWGNPILYINGAVPAGFRPTTTATPQGFISAGPDGEYGTTDDLYSWEP